MDLRLSEDLRRRSWLSMPRPRHDGLLSEGLCWSFETPVQSEDPSKALDSCCSLMVVRNY